MAMGASVVILVIGVFMALDQLRIAPDIVNILFIALVSIVAGSAIVAIGGGGIAPMRQYWERTLDRAQEEAPKVRDRAQGSTERIKDRARERADQARQVTSDTSASGSHAATSSDDETVRSRPALDPDPSERREDRPVDDRTRRLTDDDGGLTQRLRQPRYDDEERRQP
jgi:hypothetical protein